MTDVIKAATEIFNTLPKSVIQTVMEKPYCGEVIQTGTHQQGNADASALKSNYVILKPIQKYWPTKVCSGYLYADVILYLDVLFGGNLLTPRDGNTKRTLALIEGGKIKKLVGHLRHITICRTKNSTMEEIEELKQFVIRRTDDPRKWRNDDEPLLREADDEPLLG